MGLFACFADPAAGPQGSQQSQRLDKDLTAARADVARLQAELQRLQAGWGQPDGATAAPKKDAATEMPSIAVQARPPVMLESRIPQPSSDDQPSTTAAPVEVCRKSRIPAHPADSPTKGNSNRSTKDVVCDFPPAGLIRAVSAKACQAAQQASTINPTSPTAAGGQNLAEVAEYEHRIVLLQQQLKVADAFRASLEAQLRDARFANSNLQTQVLSLQTKFEKAIEEQVAELEKLSSLRKEGQERYDRVAAELAELKRLHETTSAGQVAAFKGEASTAVKRAIDSELKLSQVTSQLQETQEELHNTKARLCSTEQLVEHMADKANITAEQHQQAVKKLEAELKAQKAIYDSTVVEMLQLSNNHNELKQEYNKLQSETKNNGEVVQLVQQELAELSYYAAAGRVALGAAPEAVRTFSTSEVSLTPRVTSSGFEAQAGSIKLSPAFSADSFKAPAAVDLAGMDVSAEAAGIAAGVVEPVLQEAVQDNASDHLEPASNAAAS